MRRQHFEGLGDAGYVIGFGFDAFAVYLGGKGGVEGKLQGACAQKLQLFEARMVGIFRQKEDEGGVERAERRVGYAQVEQAVVGARIGAYAETASVGLTDLHGEYIGVALDFAHNGR